MIPMFLAIDTTSYLEARELLSAVGDLMEVKFGLEFFYANGAQGCRVLRSIGANRERQMFLDLKLHDIPNTIAGAIRSVLPINPTYISVHACDGVEPLKIAKAAVDGAPGQGLSRPKLLAVTVLTSVAGHSVLQDVATRAMYAFEAGFDGLICSPHEVLFLRQAFGPGQHHWKDMFLMCPGIVYPADADRHDQARVATPREAMDAGADAIVIGRAITQATKPVEMAAEIMQTLA